jgi:F-type H+-transporting ATPase subunit a
MYPSNLMNTSLSLTGVEVGVHYYWDIAGISVHGQVFMVIWFVIFLLLGASLLGTSKLQRIQEGWQNFIEIVIEFKTEIDRNQLGESF